MVDTCTLYMQLERKQNYNFKQQHISKASQQVHLYDYIRLFSQNLKGRLHLTHCTMHNVDAQCIADLVGRIWWCILGDKH